MQNSNLQISIQKKRFFTPGFAVLCGLAGLVILGRVAAFISTIILGEESSFPAAQLPIVMACGLAAWAMLAFLFYQIHETSKLDINERRINRRYSLFDVTVFRATDDLSKWTWLQPKTAHIGSRKLVIDAGNANERNKAHLIEMPPEATWEETLTLGKLIADSLSIECKPYRDRITDVNSCGADTV